MPHPRTWVHAPEAKESPLWPLVVLLLAAAVATAWWLIPIVESIMRPPPVPCGRVVRLSSGYEAFVECTPDDGVVIKSGDSGPP